MIIGVYGEFETMDAAETAMARIRRQIDGIKKISVLTDKNRYKKTTELISYPYQARTETYTLIQASVSMQNYTTDTIYTEQDPANILEPQLRESVQLCILCDMAAANEVSRLMTAMGGSHVSRKT